MPGKSPTQRIEELTEQLRRLETTSEVYRSVTDLRLSALEKAREAREAEHSKVQEELTNKVAELTAKLAALEERSRQHEKTSDRGWNIGQAAIISAVSIIGGALLSLLVQLAIKK